MAAEPTPTQYICWVQRSLIRNSWPDLKVDGNASSPAYRDAVKRFRIENGITKLGEEHKPGSDAVDELTQDQLIRLNHSDPHYTEWVQSALIKKGLLKPGVNRAEPIMELPGSLTRQALRVFQKASGLKVDGWVGSKTELALMKLSGIAPPDDTGKPTPCIRGGTKPKPTEPNKPFNEDDQLNHKLRQTNDWMLEFPSLYKPEQCLVCKLLQLGADDRVPLFAEYFNNSPQSDAVPARGLRSALKRRIARGRAAGLEVTPALLAQWLGAQLNDMRDSVDSAWRADCTFDRSSHARRFVHRLSRDRKHVFSCPSVRNIVDDWVARKGFYEC